jgi:hypothetical protein
MSSSVLPDQFRDLELFVNEWALAKVLAFQPFGSAMVVCSKNGITLAPIGLCWHE